MGARRSIRLHPRQHPPSIVRIFARWRIAANPSSATCILTKRAVTGQTLSALTEMTTFEDSPSSALMYHNMHGIQHSWVPMTAYTRTRTWSGIWDAQVVLSCRVAGPSGSAWHQLPWGRHSRWQTLSTWEPTR